MDQVSVAVCSPDPFVVLGVEELLCAGSSRYTAVPAERCQEAHVAVVVATEADDDTITLLTRVSRSTSAALVLVVDRVREDDLTRIVRCRVASVLSRSAVSGDALRTAVEQALVTVRRHPGLEAELMTQLDRVAAGVLGPKHGEPSLLSPRERDVLRLLSDGHDTAEIARRLTYSERTIKNVVQSLLTRLELRNRVHAVAYAMRAGVL